jgi:DNA-binding beta-propeller fold protein YncE
MASNADATVNAANGVRYMTVPGLLGDIRIPILYRFPTVTIRRHTPVGLVETTAGFEIDPGDIRQYRVTAPLPAFADWRPSIRSANLKFTKEYGPILEVKATRYSPAPNRNQLEVLVLADPKISQPVYYVLSAAGLTMVTQDGPRDLPLPIPAGPGAWLAYNLTTLFYMTQGVHPRIIRLSPINGESLGEQRLPPEVLRADAIAASADFLYLLDSPAKTVWTASIATGELVGQRILSETESALKPVLGYDEARGQLLLVDEEGTLLDLDVEDWSLRERFSLPAADITSVSASPAALAATTADGGVLRLDVDSGAIIDRLHTAPGVLNTTAGDAPLSLATTLEGMAVDSDKIRFQLSSQVPLAACYLRFICPVRMVTVVPGLGALDKDYPLHSLHLGFQPPPPPYVYVACSGDDTLAVLDGSRNVPPVVARLPVGRAPTGVAVTKDGRTVFVSNSGEGTITVIDTATLLPIDCDPSTPLRVDGLYTGGSPGPMVLHPQEAMLYVADLERPLLYVLPADATALGGAPSAEVFDLGAGLPDECHGFTGMDISPQGGWLFLATPGEASWRGTDDVAAAGYLLRWDTEGESTDGLLPIGAKPFGVRVAPSPSTGALYACVAVRGREATGFTVVDAETMAFSHTLSQPTNLRGYEPSIINANVSVVNRRGGSTTGPNWLTTLGRYADAMFDIESAEDILITPRGSMAVVLFNNTFQSSIERIPWVGGMLVAHPQRDPHRGRGGNLGIIFDPLDPERTTGFVVATQEFPYSWPDRLALSPDGRYVHATFRGTNQVLVYDLYAIRVWIDALQIINPEAVTRPDPADPYAVRHPLETLVKEVQMILHAPADLITYLSANNSSYLDRLRAEFGTDDDVAAFVAESLADMPESIRVAEVNVGRLPAGLAAASMGGFLAGTDIDVASARWLGSQVEVTYAVLGNTTSPFRITVYASADSILDDGDAEVAERLVDGINDLGPGLHRLRFAAPGVAAIADTGGVFLVYLDSEEVVPEYSEENNLSGFATADATLWAPGLARAARRAPGLGLGTRAGLALDTSPVSALGPYLAGVAAPTTFVFTPPATVAAETASVTATVAGLAVPFTANDDGTWTAVIDMGALPADAILTVQPLDSAGQPLGAALTYAFEIVALPAWLTPGPEVEATVDWDSDKGVYRIFRYAARALAAAAPAEAPLCGDRPSVVEAGAFVCFEFFGGAVIDLRFGAAWQTTLFGCPVPALSGAAVYDDTGRGALVEAAVPGAEWWQAQLRTRLGAFDRPAAGLAPLNGTAELAELPALLATPPIIGADLSLAPADSWFDLDLLYSADLAFALSQRLPAGVVPQVFEDTSAVGTLAARGGFRVQVSQAAAAGQPTGSSAAALSLSIAGGATLEGQAHTGTLALLQTLALDTGAGSASLLTDLTATARRGSEVLLLHRPVLHADDLFDQASWQWLPAPSRGAVGVRDLTAPGAGPAARGPGVDLVASIRSAATAIAPAEPLVVTVTVANAGDAPSPACQARLVWSRDELIDPNDAVLDNAIAVPALDPGAGGMQTLAVALPETVDGCVWLGLAVDPADTVVEADEANNQATVALVVQAFRFGTVPHDAPATALDLGLLTDSLALTDLALGGADPGAWFRLELPAPGTADDAAVMSLAEGSQRADLQLYDAAGALVATGSASGGEAWESTLSLAGLSAGPYWLRAGVSLAAVVHYDLFVLMTARRGSDLVVDRLAPPPAIRSGEAATAWATLRNQGNEAAPPFVVRLECSQAPGVLAEVAVPGLPVGATADVAVPFLAPAGLPPAQSVLFTLAADALGQAVELVETNNANSASALVAAAADPFEAAQAATGAADLGTIRGARTFVGFGIDSPFDLDALRFQLVAPGTADSLIRLAPADVSLAAVLLPEGGAWLTLPATRDASGLLVSLDGQPAGSYLLCVRAQGTPVDSYTATIVGPAALEPNLLVSGLAAVPSAALPSAAVTATARVASNGMQPTPACDGQFYLSPDDAVSPAEDIPLGAPVAIPAIAAGDTLDVSQALTLPAGLAAGWYRLALVVDTANAVAESAETDNLRLTPLAVLPAGDALEDNSSADSATPVSFTAGTWSQTDLTLLPDDEDWFEFSLATTGSSSQSVRLACAGPEGAVGLSLYDLTGTLVASTQSFWGDGSLSLRGLPPGTYRVQVRGVGEAFQSGYAIAIGQQSSGRGLSYCSAAGAAPPNPGSCPCLAPAEECRPRPGSSAAAFDSSRTATLVRRAVDLWAEASGLPLNLALTYEYAELSAGHLAGARITASDAAGIPTAGHLVIDRDASGDGWFASLPQSRTDTRAPQVPADRYDLLSVLCHEVGHLLGFQTDRLHALADPAKALGLNLAADGEHLQPSAGAAALVATIGRGERRLPTPAEGRLLALLRTGSSPTARGLELAFRAAGTADRPVLYARSGATASLGFIMLADDPVPEPLPEGVVNGRFTVTDPEDPAFGWATHGPVTVSAGQALLREGDSLFTDLSQTFALPAGTRTLRLVLTPELVKTDGEALPEAVEVALLSRGDGTEVLEPMAGLADSDALLNLQSTGTIWLSPAATIVAADPVTSGGTIPRGDSLQVLVNLPASRNGSPVTLFVDLVGSGDLNSSLAIESVDAHDREAVVLRLARGWNAFSLPLAVEDPSPASVLAGVNYARAVWTFDAARNAYVPVDRVLPGRGYLVLALEAAGISVLGTPPAPDWTHLVPGWNLLASPDGSRPPDADTDLSRALWRLDPRRQTSQRAPPGEAIDPLGVYWFWLAP